MKKLQLLLQEVIASIHNSVSLVLVILVILILGSCLTQDEITNNHKKIVNIYTVYEISNNNNNNSNYPTLENCLFGAVSLTKNADIDKYKYFDMDLELMDMDLIHIQGVEIGEMQ